MTSDPDGIFAEGPDAARIRPLPSVDGPAYRARMCRNIVPLNNLEPAATDDECHEAALQFVRKISGANAPSRANRAVFDRAVAEIAQATRALLDELVTTAPPKNRDDEAAKRRARSADRYEAIRVYQQEKKAAAARS